MRVGRPAVAGHLDTQFPAVHDVSVQGVHGILAVALVVEANKGEASALPRVGVARYVDVADVSVALEDALHILRGGAVSQVVHFQGGHPVDNRRGPAVAHGEASVRGRPRLLTSSAEENQEGLGEAERPAGRLQWRPLPCSGAVPTQDLPFSDYKKQQSAVFRS